METTGKPGKSGQSTELPREGVILGGVGLLLAVGLVRPSQAFPGWGMLVAMGILALVVLACLDRRRAVLEWGGWVALTGGLAAGWALFTALGGWTGMYLVTAAVPVGTAILGVLVFFLGAAAARGGGVVLAPWVAGGVVVAAVLMALHAHWQVFGPAGAPGTFRSMERNILETLSEGDPMREGLLHAVRERRASSTLGAPNIFGSFMAAGLLAALALAFGAGGWRRAVLAVAALLMASALVLSGSRGGIMAALAGAGLLAAILPAWRLHGQRVYTRVVCAAGGAVGLVLAGLLLLFSLEGGGSRWVGGSGMGQRIAYWTAAVEAWREAPLLGHGTGGYELVYLVHRQPGSNETRHAHSWFFQSLAEGGIVGTALLLAFLAAAMFAGLRVVWALAGARRDRASFAAVAALVAAAAGILVHGLAEYTLAFREAALLLMLLLGIPAGLAGRNGAHSRAGRTVLLVLLLVLVAAGAWWLRLEWRLALAGDHREAAIVQLDEPGGVGEALRLANRAVELAPRDATNWETRGEMRARLHDGRAEADLEEAVRRLPSSARLRQRLALYHASRGRLDDAIGGMEAAIARHPLSPEHRLQMALLLHRAGRTEEALDVYSRAEGLGLPNQRVRRLRAEVEEELGVSGPEE